VRERDVDRSLFFFLSFSFPPFVSFDGLKRDGLIKQEENEHGEKKKKQVEVENKRRATTSNLVFVKKCFHLFIDYVST